MGEAVSSAPTVVVVVTVLTTRSPGVKPVRVGRLEGTGMVGPDAWAWAACGRAAAKPSSAAEDSRTERRLARDMTGEPSEEDEQRLNYPETRQMKPAII